MSRLPEPLASLVVAVAISLGKHVSSPVEGSPRRLAIEVARTLVSELSYQDADGAWFVERGWGNVARTLDAVLAHRVREGWIAVDDINEAAGDGASAWVAALREADRRAA
jgi:hypothetical protein